MKDSDAPVVPFDREHLQEAKYVMAIGDQVYISSPEQKNTVKRLEENEGFTIGPGQFAYILTKETVRLPCNTIGFISIRTAVKFSGLVNISGFHVDPGYVGKIIFSVFNAGPSVIHLKRGERLFSIWIANLDQPATPFSGKGFNEIDPRFLTSISGNYTTAFELNELMRGMRKDLENLNNEVNSLRSTKIQWLIFLGILALFMSGFMRDIGLSSWHWLGQNYTWFGNKLSAPSSAPLPPPANQRREQ